MLLGGERSTENTRGQGFQKCRCAQEEKVLQGRKVEGTIRAKGKINGIGGQNLLLGGEKGRKNL